MKVIKYKECGEFWGAGYCEDRAELEITKEEVKDMIYTQIDLDGLDYIPKVLDVYLDDYEFEINTDDYLTENDKVELQNYIDSLID